MLPEDFEQTVGDLAKKDRFYHQLEQECHALEVDYHRILDYLPPDDRDALLRYISLCEELEYRKAQLAATYYAANGTQIFKRI